MAKFSRAERKAYNEGLRDGRAVGYIVGYKDGLEDGNIFKPIIKAVENIKTYIDSLPPDVREGLIIASEEYDLEVEDV